MIDNNFAMIDNSSCDNTDAMVENNIVNNYDEMIDDCCTIITDAGLQAVISWSLLLLLAAVGYCSSLLVLLLLLLLATCMLVSAVPFCCSLQLVCHQWITNINSNYKESHCSQLKGEAGSKIKNNKLQKWQQQTSSQQQQQVTGALYIPTEMY